MSFLHTPEHILPPEKPRTPGRTIASRLWTSYRTPPPEHAIITTWKSDKSTGVNSTTSSSSPTPRISERPRKTVSPQPPARRRRVPKRPHLQHLPADPHKRLHRPGGIPYTPQLRHPQPPRHHRRHQRINILFRQKSVRRLHRPPPQRHCLLQCNPPLIRHHPHNQTDLSPENPAHNVLFHPCPFQTANTPPQNTATQSSSGNPPAETDRTFLQPPGLAPQSGDTAGKGHPVRIPPKKRDRLPESSSSPATPEYTAFHLWHCPS